MARKLVVEIVGDSKSLERAFKRSGRSANQFSVAMTKVNRGISSGGLVGGGALAVGLKKSVDAASNLQEQMSKTNVVFGQSAQAVDDWSKTTVRSMGLAQDQALETASSFGALLRPLGLTGAEAAKQSKALTQLGADLASFYNTSVQDALDAIRSGLVGESEPLRRYGVLLSETRVQQQAATAVGKEHAKHLTDQEKVLGRLKIIFKDTAQAQGDFARTSGGFANQQRIAAANIRQLQSDIGTGLIPALTVATGALNDMAEGFKNVRHWSREADDGLSGFARDVTRFATMNVKDLAKMFKHHLGVVASGFGGGGGPGSRLGATPAGLRGLLAPAVPAGLWTKPPPKVLNTAKEAGRKQGEAIRKAWAEGARSPRAKAQIAAGARRVDLRNQWFDASVSRQLDRAQDLALRKQLVRLRAIAQEVKARLGVTKDATRRLTLEDQLLGILRNQRSVQKQIGDQIKTANQALKDRADAIKSAVLDRLQRRQTDILNRRALADAREQLRIARQIGGPRGIREAARGLQDVQFDILRARLEAAPATLRKGGQFALGGVVTINVHGVTDPDQVARKVTEILQRRQRRTTTQTRGPAAGTAGGAH